jgi:DNA-binding GntR family transcriptional regulator
VVTVVTRDDVVDIYEVREVLEGLAARRFAERAPAADLRRLEGTLDEIRAAAAEDDYNAMLAAKNNFYDALLEGAGNDVVRSTLMMLRSRISLLRGATLRQPGRLHSTVVEIEAILEAIRARDAARAEDVSQLHVRNAAQVALSRWDAGRDDDATVPDAPRAAAPTAG